MTGPVFSGCGLAGIIRTPDAPRDTPGLADVRRMTRALAHRGPHGEGLFEHENIVLGHRRLSVLDLADTGAQPMTRDHLTIVYNGETYNHAALRRDLADRYRFTSGTDTEVVLRAWQRWGPGALERMDGMYAFAIWDHRARSLTLARDRLGIKPLYLHRGTGFLAFASEIEALLQCRAIAREPNLDLLAHQLLCSTTLQVDRRATPVAAVEALPAATRLTVHRDGRTHASTYWRLPATSERGGHRDVRARELATHLESAVTSMLMGDVPAATFLSGGLDSSAITAIAASTLPVTAFTVVHTDSSGAAPDQDREGDLHHSRILARLHPDRIEHRVLARPHALTLDDIDDTCDLAAPGGDLRHASILDNYRAVAAHGHRVVLNGQGADELMGGYINQPSFVRHLHDVRNPHTTPLLSLPASRQAPGLSPDVLAHRTRAHRAVLDFHAGLEGPPLERAHRLLVHLQLPRILQFEDYLSMRAGVEARFPFLDHHIVEACFREPFDAHVDRRALHGKALLRRALTTRLPAVLVDRPKQVFPWPDPTGTQHSLAALARTHEDELRADPLLGHLLHLPATAELVDATPQFLWQALTLWRWHRKLRTPPAPDPHPGTTPWTTAISTR
ncbi:asparagine synthase (glutamine-hydrolyzing) [Embleya scabrispora]|uniref:asparagine synthase (glutamine-hydrolyzing) n=1 Tax=Embleya scabrispora TaxID=159449 RepID=UPI0013750A8A|nr:asparagine synthase (glutamine-hydrolyzing) [Embleya scabrispora]